MSNTALLLSRQPVHCDDGSHLLVCVDEAAALCCVMSLSQPSGAGGEGSKICKAQLHKRDNQHWTQEEVEKDDSVKQHDEYEVDASLLSQPSGAGDEGRGTKCNTTGQDRTKQD